MPEEPVELVAVRVIAIRQVDKPELSEGEPEDDAEARAAEDLHRR